MTQPQPQRIYLAGSWKNQQEIILIRDILKAQGHEVDCFASEENGRISFCWAKLDDIQDKLQNMDAKDMIAVQRVQEAFREDKKWLDWCNIVLLILPSGKSAHLEAGYAKGQGKVVVIFGDLQKGDFDVMYGFADAIFRSSEVDQMINFVNTRTHTPAAQATEYTIEQIAEIDNRIRKERKDEREQVLDALEEFLNSDDHLSMFKWEVREQIRSLRCGATDEGGERR